MAAMNAIKNIYAHNSLMNCSGFWQFITMLRSRFLLFKRLSQGPDSLEKFFTRLQVNVMKVVELSFSIVYAMISLDRVMNLWWLMNQVRMSVLMHVVMAVHQSDKMLSIRSGRAVFSCSCNEQGWLSCGTHRHGIP
jgi:hypothetical protein